MIYAAFDEVVSESGLQPQKKIELGTFPFQKMYNEKSILSVSKKTRKLALETFILIEKKSFA